jgi:hypothetical protein
VALRRNPVAVAFLYVTAASFSGKKEWERGKPIR